MVRGRCEGGAGTAAGAGGEGAGGEGTCGAARLDGRLLLLTSKPESISQHSRPFVHAAAAQPPLPAASLCGCTGTACPKMDEPWRPRAGVVDVREEALALEQHSAALGPRGSAQCGSQQADARQEASAVDGGGGDGTTGEHSLHSLLQIDAEAGLLVSLRVIVGCA